MTEPEFRCGECGSVVEEDDSFCNRCGSAVRHASPGQASCLVCGGELTGRFCRSCGNDNGTSLGSSRLTTPQFGPPVAPLAPSTPGTPVASISTAPVVTPVYKTQYEVKPPNPAAGWYLDPENSTQQRFWDGVVWTQNVAALTQTKPFADISILRPWKTSVVFSILGLVIGFPLLALVGMILAAPLMIVLGIDSTRPGSGGPELVSLAASLLKISYALLVYPSFFSTKPLLKSSRTISFANLMFGGIIFGPIWNANLTKQTKGTSHIVSAVLEGIWVAWIALQFLLVLIILISIL